MDDVGLEPGSIISELGGFPVKEMKFRKEMEKLRTSKTVDLQLLKLDRDRNQLIVQVRFLRWSHDRLLKSTIHNFIFVSVFPRVQHPLRPASCLVLVSAPSGGQQSQGDFRQRARRREWSGQRVLHSTG